MVVFGVSKLCAFFLKVLFGMHYIVYSIGAILEKHFFYNLLK